MVDSPYLVMDLKVVLNAGARGYVLSSAPTANQSFSTHLNTRIDIHCSVGALVDHSKNREKHLYVTDLVRTLGCDEEPDPIGKLAFRPLIQY
jgi:hypothetical protein